MDFRKYIFDKFLISLKANSLKVLHTLALVNIKYGPVKQRIKETGQRCKPNIKQQDGGAKYLQDF